MKNIEEDELRKTHKKNFIVECRKGAEDAVKKSEEDIEKTEEDVRVIQERSSSKKTENEKAQSLINFMEGKPNG